MEIIEYDPKYKDDFIKLNTDWIVDNFGALEDEDLETFSHIEDDLNHRAMIYFAVENGVALASCMAKPMKENRTWEICKLASNKEHNHKGCGSAVFKAAMDWAISHGASRLFLLSNSKLKPAIHIYEKFGFHEVKLDDYEYVRGNIAFEYIVNLIRFAEKNDIDALSALDRHISAEELEKCVNLRRIIVEEVNGTIVGWLRFGMFWDNTPFMNMLFVVNENRGKGLGTALCEFWENEMKVQGYDIVLTSTLSNEQAQHFYRKRGYRDCGSLILPEEPLEIILMKKL